MRSFCSGWLIVLGFVVATADCAADAPAYRSPLDIAANADGSILAVSDHTACSLAFIDAAAGKVLREVKTDAQPVGVSWAADGKSVFVTQPLARNVAEISVADAKIVRRIPAGARPQGVAVARKSGLLLVTDIAPAQLIVKRLGGGEPADVAKIPLVREPFCVAVTNDESLAVVSNQLPAGSALEPDYSALVSLVDLKQLKCVAEIKLPPNASCVRQVATSPDAKWAYVVHTVGRTGLPAVQLDRGWVNTNAVSILDLTNKTHFATLLMDNVMEGAADPWGVALAADGNTLWVTLAGVGQLARIDLAALHKKLAADDAKRPELVNDLAYLYANNLIQRWNLPAGQSPRGIAMACTGKLALAMYYGGQVLMVDPASGRVAGCVALADQPPVDEARRGEICFHDARTTFQHWLSCATCHPNGGRVDGLNWDLPNDGLGNPKSAKSMINAGHGGPLMWRGERGSLEVTVASGFRFEMHQPEAAEVKATVAYLQSLKGEPSPYLQPDGQLTDAAKRGKELFHGHETHCATCHAGELYTNLRPLDIGTRGLLDPADHTEFVTPSLIEVWRTAPYLHDGRAADLRELFTKHNPDDKHGRTKHLTKEQLDDLVAYLLSL